MTEQARPRPQAVRVSPGRAVWGRWVRRVERGLALFGLCALLYLPFFGTIDIVSDSMAPTLKGSDAGGDLVFYESLSLYFCQPDRHDIVYFTRSDGMTRTLIAKRVVAFPGETIRFEKGEVLINDRILAKPEGLDVRYFGAGKTRKGRSYKVEKGYFVLGDSQRKSWDSRFFGEILHEEVRGRAVAIIWPPSRWRWF